MNGQRTGECSSQQESIGPIVQGPAASGVGIKGICWQLAGAALLAGPATYSVSPRSIPSSARSLHLESLQMERPKAFKVKAEEESYWRQNIARNAIIVHKLACKYHLLLQSTDAAIEENTFPLLVSISGILHCILTPNHKNSKLIYTSTRTLPQISYRNYQVPKSSWRQHGMHTSQGRIRTSGL